MPIKRIAPSTSPLTPATAEEGKTSAEKAKKEGLAIRASTATSDPKAVLKAGHDSETADAPPTTNQASSICSHSNEGQASGLLPPFSLRPRRDARPIRSSSMAKKP